MSAVSRPQLIVNGQSYIEKLYFSLVILFHTLADTNLPHLSHCITRMMWLVKTVLQRIDVNTATNGKICRHITVVTHM
jgi:hypothetical protein